MTETKPEQDESMQCGLEVVEASEEARIRRALVEVIVDETVIEEPETVYVDVQDRETTWQSSD